MSGFVHTPMTLPPVSFGTDPTGSIAVQILGGGAGGGGGASSFLGLTDTPVSYSGQGGKAVAVNAGATGLEFVTAFDGAFASLSGLPTTLAGYGITDAAEVGHTQSIASIIGLSGQLTALSDAIDLKADLGHTHAFSSLTGIPTTLAGYGITDAAAASHTHAFADITGKPTTLAGYGITDGLGSVNVTLPANAQVLQYSGGQWINRSLTAAGIAAFSHVHAFSSLTGIPTTLAGYGITDAAPATIALGEIPLSVDGQGAATAAIDRRRRIERACVITSASIAADVAGSVSITFKRDRGGSVTTLGTIALSSAQDVRDTTLSGWTTDLAAGDILIAECGAGTTLTAFTATLGRRAA